MERTMVDDARLVELVHDLESDRTERKRTAGDRSAIRKAICAMANDLPGHDRPGVIFVGVENDGSYADIDITDDLLVLLSGMRDNGDILPVPSMVVEKRTIEGHDVAVVTVTPAAEPPVRYRGRVWVRVGPSTREASADDERILRERRRSLTMCSPVTSEPSRNSWSRCAS
jgi:ATP-dependent DNA helicase RecG